MGKSRIGIHTDSALLGMVIGGIVGVGIGLLVAPEQGQKMRRRVAYRLNHLVGRVADLIEKVNRMQEESEARINGAAVIAETQNQADAIMQDANNLLDELKRSQAPR